MPDWASKTKPFPVLILSKLSRAAITTYKPCSVELRLDLIGLQNESISIFNRTKKFISELRAKKISVLLTARLCRDGGEWNASKENLRRKILFELAPSSDALDLEAEILEEKKGRIFAELLKKRMRVGAALIVSHHDLKKMPNLIKLNNIRAMALRVKANRLKITVMTKNEKETEKIADWAVANSCEELPITVIAMGSIGRWTRWVMPLRLGGPAYAPVGRPVASGQISYRELNKLLEKSK